MYPSTWTYFIKSGTQGSGDSNIAPYYGEINFTGNEGQIGLIFGNGFGGQYCEEFGPFGDAGGPEINNTAYNFTFSYQSSKPNSLEFIKNILSTFKFTQ